MAGGYTFFSDSRVPFFLLSGYSGIRLLGRRLLGRKELGILPRMSSRLGGLLVASTVNTGHPCERCIY